VSDATRHVDRVSHLVEWWCGVKSHWGMESWQSSWDAEAVVFFHFSHHGPISRGETLKQRSWIVFLEANTFYFFFSKEELKDRGKGELSFEIFLSRDSMQQESGGEAHASSSSSSNLSSSSSSTAHYIPSFDVLMLFLRRDPLTGNPDTSQLLSKECFERWLKTRKIRPKDPPRAFKDAIKTVVTANNRCKPFPEDVEADLLKRLRKEEIWPCFAHDESIGIGKRGWRILGFNERKRLGKELPRKPKWKPKRRKVEHDLDSEEEDDLEFLEEDDDDDEEEKNYNAGGDNAWKYSFDFPRVHEPQLGQSSIFDSETLAIFKGSEAAHAQHVDDTNQFLDSIFALKPSSVHHSTQQSSEMHPSTNLTPPTDQTWLSSSLSEERRRNSFEDQIRKHHKY